MLLFVFLAGCAHAGADSNLRRAEFLMGTTCEISVHGSEADAREALDEIRRVERLISTWRPDSPLTALNASPDGRLAVPDHELIELVSSAVDWSRRTDGAFNPLVGRLVEAWHLRASASRPDDAVLLNALRSTSLDNITVDIPASTISKRNSAAFEEGGFGKGYALDRAITLLQNRGVETATINFGGQISSFGMRWTAEVADPADRTRPIVELTLPAGSLSTSSGSEKSWDIGGQRLSHILDPRTGELLPARGSVTVFHRSGLAADILSTALYVMGPDVGLQWADANGIAAIFLTPESDGIAMRISIAAKELALRRLTPQIIERN